VDSPTQLFCLNELAMILLHVAGVQGLDGHQDLVSVTGASVKANPWVGSPDHAEAAGVVAVEK
jgi:hypothetical protein